jgi:hypothetical protein
MIPATQEGEIRGLQFEASPGEKVSKTVSKTSLMW